ncbi:MAG: hypothetical protein HOB49_12750, partial [Gemmatimonadetes bacterium]|nr:hypothetical protein [Gemmatimonadota bacterium]
MKTLPAIVLGSLLVCLCQPATATGDTTEAGRDGRPRLSVPMVAGEPTIDGDLSDPFWHRAARTSGFTKYDQEELAPEQPMLLCAATATGLWLAIEAPLPDGAVARALLTEHDAAIYTEDTFEIFLQPPGVSEGTFYQFMVSARGTRLDAKYTEGSTDIGGYSPPWRAAGAIRPESWTAEAHITYEALGLSGPPVVGEVWRANFCRDSSAGFSNAITWAYTGGSFTQPAVFGELVFTGSARTLRQDRLAGFEGGEPAVSFSLIGDFQPIITVTGELFDEAGARIYRNEMRLRDTKSVDLVPPALTTGSYLLTLNGVDEDDQRVFWQQLRFQTAKAFDLRVSSYPHAGYCSVAVDVRGIKEPIDRVEIRLETREGHRVLQQPLVDLAGGTGATRINHHDLTPGRYHIDAWVLAADGTVLDTASQSLEIFPRPAWWANDLGIDHSVPPPFESVEIDDGSISVWGRDYEFGGAAFPRQIRSQGQPLLVGDPEFRLSVGGHTIDLVSLAGRPGTTFPDAASRIASTSLDEGGSLSLTTTVEFDGFVRVDLTLYPAELLTRPLIVNELSLALPLAPELVQFLMTSNGATSNIVPVQEGFAAAFLPYVWLGNDRMGLAWTAERDQLWRPEPDRALTLEMAEDESIFRINLIAEADTLTGPATFSFALMATPVRPIPKNDPFAYPAYEAFGPVTFSEFLTYSVPPGLSSAQDSSGQGTIEFWTRRTEQAAAGPTALFSIGPVNEGITAFLGTPDDPSAIRLQSAVPGAAPLLVAGAEVVTDRFTHLALSWDAEGIRLHADGVPVGMVTGAAADAWRGMITAPGSQIRFGCNNTYHGYTGIVVDEIRVSAVPRYGAATADLIAAPFVDDEATLLLDHLDDNFRPDGQDARTVAGGVPSIGSRFVSARFDGGVQLEVGPARPGFEVLEDYGVRLFSHWGWQHEMAAFYGQPVLHEVDRVVPGLREQLVEAHRHGIQSIPYMAYPAISSTSDLIEQFGDEWRILPESTTPWQMAGSPEGYYLLNSCPNARSYRDYLVSGAVWVMEEYGFDGFYSDGLTNVVACQNEAHGCGYRDGEGRLHATWPVYSVRETLKRMYRVVKERDPQGLVANHASFNLLIPILSFSDVVYTGEHEDYENLQTGRIRFNSEPWGVYVTLLGSSEHSYSPLHAMAPLLSGSSVWGTGMVARNDQGRKDAAIRRVYHDFDTVSATWMPWWRAETAACRPTDPEVK